MLQSTMQRGAAMLTGVLLMAAVTATPAAAVTPDLVFTDLTIGSACFSAVSHTDGAALQIQLLDDVGSLKSPELLIPDPALTTYDLCFDDPVAEGDSIVVRQDLNSRGISIPALRFGTIDRNADSIKVIGGEGLKVKLKVHRCPLGSGFNVDFCPAKLTRTVDLSGDGRATVDVTSAMDLRGYDLVQVRFTTSKGDLIRVRDTVPIIVLRVGSPSLGGILPAGVSGSYKLRAKDGTVRATGTLIGGPDAPSSDFTHLGNPVTVRVGDKVTGSPPANLSIGIPKGITSANPTTDVIKGTCFPSAKVFVEDVVPQDVVLTTKADGTFAVDLTAKGGFDSGAGIRLTCLTKAFDAVESSVAVP